MAAMGALTIIAMRVMGYAPKLAKNTPLPIPRTTPRTVGAMEVVEAVVEAAGGVTMACE